MMPHHIPAFLPAVLPPGIKTEPPRWRPRVRTVHDGSARADADAVSEGDMLQAIEAAREEVGRRAQSRRPVDEAEKRPGGLTGRDLADGALRALLAVQEV